MMIPTIPPAVEQRYDGKWIAWDTETNLVVASGDSMKEVIERARDHVDQTGHLMWYHNVVKNDAVVVGSIW